MCLSKASDSTERGNTSFVLDLQSHAAPQTCSLPSTVGSPLCFLCLWGSAEPQQEVASTSAGTAGTLEPQGSRAMDGTLGGGTLGDASTEASTSTAHTGNPSPACPPDNQGCLQALGFTASKGLICKRKGGGSVMDSCNVTVMEYISDLYKCCCENCLCT